MIQKKEYTMKTISEMIYQKNFTIDEFNTLIESVGEHESKYKDVMNELVKKPTSFNHFKKVCGVVIVKHCTNNAAFDFTGEEVDCFTSKEIGDLTGKEKALADKKEFINIVIGFASKFPYHPRKYEFLLRNFGRDPITAGYLDTETKWISAFEKYQNQFYDLEGNIIHHLKGEALSSQMQELAKKVAWSLDVGNIALVKEYFYAMKFLACTNETLVLAVHDPRLALCAGFSLYGSSYVGLHEPGQFLYLIEFVQMELEGLKPMFYKPVSVNYKLMGLGIIATNVVVTAATFMLLDGTKSPPLLGNGDLTPQAPSSSVPSINFNFGNGNNIGIGNGTGNAGAGNNNAVTEWIKTLGPSVLSFLKSFFKKS